MTDWMGLNFDEVETKKSSIGKTFEVLPDCKLVATIKNCAYITGAKKSNGEPMADHIKVVLDTSKGIKEENIYLKDLSNKFTQQRLKNFLSCIDIDALIEKLKGTQTGVTESKVLNILAKKCFNNDFVPYENQKVIYNLKQVPKFKVDDDKNIIFIEPKIHINQLVTKKSEVYGDKILINGKMFEKLKKDMQEYDICHIPEHIFYNESDAFCTFERYTGQEDMFFGDCPRKRWLDGLNPVEKANLIGEDEIPF